jgi:hypothetical protein
MTASKHRWSKNFAIAAAPGSGVSPALADGRSVARASENRGAIAQRPSARDEVMIASQNIP